MLILCEVLHKPNCAWFDMGTLATTLLSCFFVPSATIWWVMERNNQSALREKPSQSIIFLALAIRPSSRPSNARKCWLRGQRLISLAHQRHQGTDPQEPLEAHQDWGGQSDLCRHVEYGVWILSWPIYCHQRCQFSQSAAVWKRLRQSRALLKWLYPGMLWNLTFSDKKIIMVQATLGNKNDSILTMVLRGLTTRWGEGTVHRSQGESQCGLPSPRSPSPPWLSLSHISRWTPGCIKRGSLTLPFFPWLRRHLEIELGASSRTDGMPDQAHLAILFASYFLATAFSLSPSEMLRIMSFTIIVIYSTVSSQGQEHPEVGPAAFAGGLALIGSHIVKDLVGSGRLVLCTLPVTSTLMRWTLI